MKRRVEKGSGRVVVSFDKLHYFHTLLGRTIRVSMIFLERLQVPATMILGRNAEIGWVATS